MPKTVSVPVLKSFHHRGQYLVAGRTVDMLPAEASAMARRGYVSLTRGAYQTREMTAAPTVVPEAVLSQPVVIVKEAVPTPTPEPPPAPPTPAPVPEPEPTVPEVPEVQAAVPVESEGAEAVVRRRRGRPARVATTEAQPDQQPELTAGDADGDADGR